MFPYLNDYRWILCTCGWWGRVRCVGSPGRQTSCRDPSGSWSGWPPCTQHKTSVLWIRNHLFRIRLLLIRSQIFKTCLEDKNLIINKIEESTNLYHCLKTIYRIPAHLNKKCSTGLPPFYPVLYDTDPSWIRVRNTDPDSVYKQNFKKFKLPNVIAKPPKEHYSIYTYTGILQLAPFGIKLWHCSFLSTNFFHYRYRYLFSSCKKNN